jgi:hypothetical protein
METISHLPCPRRTLTRALRIEPASVPADNLDFGMSLEPSRCLLDRADGQHVNDIPALQVHDDRAIGKALAPAPVVDCCYPNGGRRAACTYMPLEPPQNGIVACRHSQTGQQPFADRPPAAWPKSRTSSATRRVLRASGVAVAGSFSTNVLRAHCSLRHRQRPTWSLRITGTPWNGRSCSRPACKLCREVEDAPQPGQDRVPLPNAETSQRLSRNSTLST